MTCTKFGLNMLKRCRDIALHPIWSALRQICWRIIQEQFGFDNFSQHDLQIIQVNFCENWMNFLR